MTLFERSFLSLIRQPVKALIFFMLVFVLSVLIAGTILVHHAILNMDQNLRRRMPAIATVEFNFDFEQALEIYNETGEWPNLEFDLLTPEVIHEIGLLPQVRMFDYSIDLHFGVTGSGLTFWQDPEWQTPFFRYDQDLGVEFLVQGVSTPHFLDAREGFVELIEGRSFSEDELNSIQTNFPVLITFDFAKANEFNIGSLFDVQVVVFDRIEDGGGNVEDRSKPPLVEEIFTLEVIGIINPILPNLAEDATVNEMINAAINRSQANHRIYVPRVLAEIMFDIRTTHSQNDILFQNFFLLNDPLEFEDFAREVEKLPGNWRAVDFSRGFSDISTAMTSLQEVVVVTFTIVIGGIILATSLLVLLFLYDRKHEIGVYLALGEKKIKIFLQIVLELISLTLLGMTLALFVGIKLTDSVSREMLRQSLATPTQANVIEESHLLEEIGYRFELTHEEMLANYEIRLDINTILIFYTVGVGTILVSIVFPLFKIVRLSPKKVLL